MCWFGITVLTKRLLSYVHSMLFFAAGLLIGLGVYALNEVQKYKDFVTWKISAIPVTGIVLGSILAITFVFGICAILKFSPSMLLAYSLVLLIMALIQLTVSLSLLSTDYVEEELKSSMNISRDKYIKDEDYRKCWDTLQEIQFCCGVSGPADWKALGNMTPSSCCKRRAVEVCTGTDQYQTGCVVGIKGSLFLDLGFLLLFAFVEFLAVLIASCLAVSVLRLQRTEGMVITMHA